MAARSIEELLLSLGYVLGALKSEEMVPRFLETLRSDSDGRQRVWIYTRHLRDRLTELLREAGREEEE